MHINEIHPQPWELMALWKAVTLVIFGLEGGRDLGHYFVHRH